MEINLVDDIEAIQISAMEVEQLLPEAKERIKEKVMLDDKYREICKQVATNGNVDQNFSLIDELLCRKGRLYIPEGLQQTVIQSEHDSKVASHFGRKTTLELITRNFYWTIMERDVWKYCSECDHCQRTKAPRHAKHGLVHRLELA